MSGNFPTWDTMRALEAENAELRAKLNDGPLCDAMQPFLAEAWGEGYDAGHQDARAVQDTYPDTTPNPYRHEGEP